MRALCLFDKQNLVSKCERMTASPEPNPAPRRAIARMRVTFARPAVGKTAQKPIPGGFDSERFERFPTVPTPRDPPRLQATPPSPPAPAQMQGTKPRPPCVQGRFWETRALPPNRMRAAGASAFKHVFDFSRFSGSPVLASRPGQVIHRFFLF